MGLHVMSTNWHLCQEEVVIEQVRWDFIGIRHALSWYGNSLWIDYNRYHSKFSFAIDDFRNSIQTTRDRRGWLCCKLCWNGTNYWGCWRPHSFLCADKRINSDLLESTGVRRKRKCSKHVLEVWCITYDPMQNKLKKLFLHFSWKKKTF